MASGAPTGSEIRAAKRNAVGGGRKRCKKGKNCSAACIQAGMVCLVEMPEPSQIATTKMRDYLKEWKPKNPHLSPNPSEPVGDYAPIKRLTGDKLVDKVAELAKAGKTSADILKSTGYWNHEDLFNTALQKAHPISKEPLKGGELLERIKMMPQGLSKAELAIATGHVEENGKPDFVSFYGTLLDAKDKAIAKEKAIKPSKDWEESRRLNPDLVRQDRQKWEKFKEEMQERDEDDEYVKETIANIKKLKGREREIEMSRALMDDSELTMLRRYTSDNMSSHPDDEPGLPEVGSTAMNRVMREAAKMKKDWRYLDEYDLESIFDAHGLGDEAEGVADGIDQVSSALTRIKTTNDSRKTHYRGMDLNPQQYQQFSRLAPGDTLIDPGFSSYSSSKKVAKNFYGSRPEDGGISRKVLLVSKSPNLVDISPFSMHPDEQEALLDYEVPQRVDWVRETINGKQRTLVIGVDYD